MFFLSIAIIALIGIVILALSLVVIAIAPQSSLGRLLARPWDMFELWECKSNLAARRDDLDKAKDRVQLLEQDRYARAVDILKLRAEISDLRQRACDEAGEARDATLLQGAKSMQDLERKEAALAEVSDRFKEQSSRFESAWAHFKTADEGLTQMKLRQARGKFVESEELTAYKCEMLTAIDANRVAIGTANPPHCESAEAIVQRFATKTAKLDALTSFLSAHPMATS